jgi:hypothetical protein
MIKIILKPRTRRLFIRVNIADVFRYFRLKLLSYKHIRKKEHLSVLFEYVSNILFPRSFSSISTLQPANM